MSTGDSIPITFCLPKKGGKQTPLCLGIAFEDGTLWIRSAVYQREHPYGAVQYIFLSGSSSVGVGLLTTQHRIGFVKELIEITDSKGRSYGDTLPFFLVLNPNLIFIQVTGTRLPYLKNVLKNEAATFFL